ncbi:MAG: type III restriction endonuclease subunit M [Betaproteobacteria bacterium HGW-Betaproteobacteria-22]|nr:MAG: type III restriction endonuclease subunit M [Betaproteobacteria bacterium HGW-Betaproteobacteria-22]
MTASHSPNPPEELKQKMQAMVPEAFKDGHLDVDVLKRLLGSEIELRDESYVLNWLGKSYARLLANENARTWLKEEIEHNAQPENANSQNLLIKGDNLEVLKHLVGAYEDKIKMIYIDPPYNTGSDGFVYQDDRKFTVKQLSGLAGIDEDEAKRILDFTSSNSNSHSAWLTFMYPRLYVAHKLLSDKGLIFISIDNNEQAQLKIVCDDIFGEHNFVVDFCRKTKSTNNHDKNGINGQHESTLVYAKNKQLVKLLGDHKDLSKYTNEDNDPNGPWMSDNPTANLDGRKTKNLFKITNPNTGQVDEPPAGRHWAFSEKSLAKLIKSGQIKFKATKKIGERGFIYKRYLLKLKDKQRKVDSLYFCENEYMNQVATRELTDLLNVAIFDYAKPVCFIQKLIEFCTDDGDIVMDFFVGSGTTAHAVFSNNIENIENKETRQFICVQIDENTKDDSAAYKAGYKTIFDITKTRIEKAAAKFKTENPDFQGDLGFKIYETVYIPDKYQDTPVDLTENIELFDAHKLTKADRLSLMRTWALQDNVPLTLDFVQVDLAGYTAYQAKHILYFIEPNITLDAVVKLLEQLDNNPDFKPSRLVVFGYLLESKIQREMTEAVKQYNNRKGIELTLDVRY